MLCIIIAGMQNHSTHMRNLFHHRQIVQHYPPQEDEEMSLPTTNFSPHRLFFQEQMFEELEKTAIVEDYHPHNGYNNFENNQMDEEYQPIDEQPYEQLSMDRYHFPSRKILDSSSSGRQLPARNSSVSSFSSCQNIQSHSLKANTAEIKRLQQFEELPVRRINLDGQNMKKASARARREVDSSAQKRQRLNKIKKVQEAGCNCKKSKCLKMYCQCFNLQIHCSQNCNCVGCGNMNENQSHQKAVLEALTRNPRAFAEDVQQIPTVFHLGLDLSQVRRGCKCRKTKCLKKYCQCFNSGQLCGVFCQCDGCANCEGNK